jgi:HK97 family phage portal protein
MEDDGLNPFKALFRPRDRPRNSVGGGLSFLFGGTPSGQVVNERTAMQNTVVYACVRILAETVASLPLHVFRYTDGGEKQHARDHPLYHLLHSTPNPLMTSFVFRETLMSHILLWGNAYAQIIRDGRGRIAALYPLLPSRMDVSMSPNGALLYTYHKDWDDAYPTASRDGFLVTLRQEDVLHICGLGFDGLVGYSPIAMARNAIGMSIATEDYGARFFANSARPSGVLEHPGVIRDHERLRQSWQAQFSGAGAHSLAILEENMKFHPISINPNDAQFLDTRKFQVQEIARIFRVPLSMLGDLERATYNNAEQLSLDFVKFSLTPWLTRFEQAFEQQLLSPSEHFFIRFNVGGLLRGDLKSRYESYAIGIQNGFMSPNDVRELEDWNRIPEAYGSRFYANGNMIPLERAGDQYNSNRTDKGES